MRIYHVIFTANSASTNRARNPINLRRRRFTRNARCSLQHSAIFISAKRQGTLAISKQTKPPRISKQFKIAPYGCWEIARRNAKFLFQWASEIFPGTKQGKQGKWDGDERTSIEAERRDWRLGRNLLRFPINRIKLSRPVNMVDGDDELWRLGSALISAFVLINVIIYMDFLNKKWKWWNQICRPAKTRRHLSWEGPIPMIGLGHLWGSTSSHFKL